MKRAMLALLVLVMAGAGQIVWAAEATTKGDAGRLTLSLTKDYTASPWTSKTGYKDQAVGKLVFGVKNLLLGWTDLFVEPKEAADAGRNVLQGVGYGLKDAIENTLGGAVHLVTFFVPQVDAPLPEGGVFTS